jgi:hypothetical protein
MAITTPLDRPITAWLPVHIEGKLAEFFEAIRLKLVELDGGGGALVENSVLLGTAGGDVGGSAELVYDSSRRFVSTGATIGVRATGPAGGAMQFQLEDFAGRLQAFGGDLVQLVFQGSATTRQIHFEGRSGEFKAGSPSFHIGNASSSNPTIAIGDNIIRSHQHLNVTLFGASYASGVANGLGCLGIQPATTIPTTNPPTLGVIVYVDGSGNLVARTSAGNVRTLATV